MKKKFLTVITIIAAMISSMCPTSVFARDTENDDAQSALRATLSYYETYLAGKSSFDVREYEDILLTLIAERLLNNTDSTVYKSISDKAVSYAKGNMNPSGEFVNLSGDVTVYYNSAEFYALMILIADEAGYDAKSFNSSNLIEKFAAVFSSCDPGNPTVNPYYLKYIGAVLSRYAADIPNAGALADKLKSIIMSYYNRNGSDAGIDCWNSGISVDDTGAVLPALYFMYFGEDASDADISDVKNAVDSSVAWALTMLKADGTVDAYGSANADSTGLMLHMLATYKNAKSELNFNGLLTLRDTARGMYVSEYDKHYTTRDAFCGLISYYLYVTGGGYYLAGPVTEAPKPKVPDTGDNAGAAFAANVALAASVALASIITAAAVLITYASVKSFSEEFH